MNPESFFPSDLKNDTPGLSPAKSESDIDFAKVRSAFAIALHMHQPLIPAGGGELQTAKVIGNLQFMFEHPEVQDAHNAGVFLSCYGRMAEFIAELVAEGKRPRVMLDYSGCLLYALQQMGANEVLDGLRRLTGEAECRRCVEFLGTAWGHAVAPSTPVGDFRLHVRAWREHFGKLFGEEALGRVRGFSPPEMALPNHPEVAFEFVRTLRECGYRWVMVQEHTVEGIGGAKHVPHRLVARNARGEVQTIIAIIKTQGSDTKLVGQMQPYYEAKGLGRVEVAGRAVPQLVVQISDGENGGVMMNEFPPKFMQVMREASGTQTPAMNVSEYLDHLEAVGVREEDFAEIRPIYQGRIFERMEGGRELEEVIAELRKEDGRFHVEGGSWTSDMSWVRGYDRVLKPMEAASAAFAEKAGNAKAGDPAYREAMFNLLLGQTSCFRYWGEGTWADYGREFCRRAIEAAGRIGQ